MSDGVRFWNPTASATMRMSRSALTLNCQKLVVFGHPQNFEACVLGKLYIYNFVKCMFVWTRTSEGLRHTDPILGIEEISYPRMFNLSGWRLTSKAIVEAARLKMDSNNPVMWAGWILVTNKVKMNKWIFTDSKV